MARTVSIPGLGSEFDAFLFAPIGEEGNGMLLSVLSALARLDVDPWQEAAGLARLPVESATRRLTALLEALPGVAPMQRDPGTVAARLIGLLPHTANIHGSSNIARVTTKPASAFIWALVMMLVLSAQWMAAGHHAPAPGAEASSAPTSSSVTPPARP